MVKTLRILGRLEGASFLILVLVAMPLKYAYGNPIYVKTMGPIHGTLFIAYVVLANIVGDRLNWNSRTRTYSYLAAVLPFGTFVFERKFLSKSAQS